MYATDANTVIYYFKGHPNVVRRLHSTSPHQFAIPAVVLFELEVGTAGATARRDALDALTRICAILPFDEAAAKRAAAIRNELSKTGKLIGPLDTLIAATALANGLTLVTHNTAEFSRVPGLLLEDWYVA